MLASLSSPDEAQLFLQELLTANERRDVVLRHALRNALVTLVTVSGLALSNVFIGSIVIEQGGSGSALASTAVNILNAYFSADEIGTAILGENQLMQ